MFCLLVVDLLAFHHDPQFTARLDRVTLGDTGLFKGNVFKVLQALDVALHHFSPCTGSRAGDGVANLDNGRDERGHFNLVVVSTNGVEDVGAFTGLFGKLHAEDGVRQFALFIADFSDVVEKPCALGCFGVQAQLSGHGGTQVGDLTAVLE